jgi:hypothetical protein
MHARVGKKASFGSSRGRYRAPLGSNGSSLLGCLYCKRNLSFITIYHFLQPVTYFVPN